MSPSKVEEKLPLDVPFFAGKNANIRQEVLMGRAKVFDQEKDAVKNLATISWAFPLAIVASSLLDLFMVIAFQKWFHPWRRIIAQPEAEKKD